MVQDKKEVIKASAAIQIENSITLLQRRAWNLLLANAYDALPTVEEHHVSVAALTKALGYTSRNEAHLREALTALMTTVLEWNLIGKDHTLVWGATTLLAHAGIENGTCTYSYSPLLRRRLIPGLRAENPRRRSRALRGNRRGMHPGGPPLWVGDQQEAKGFQSQVVS